MKREQFMNNILEKQIKRMISGFDFMVESFSNMNKAINETELLHEQEKEEAKKQVMKDKEVFLQKTKFAEETLRNDLMSWTELLNDKENPSTSLLDKQERNRRHIDVKKCLKELNKLLKKIEEIK